MRLFRQKKNDKLLMFTKIHNKGACMQNQKFHYLMSGAILTLLVLFGAFAIFLSRAQASESPTSVPATTMVTVREPEVSQETTAETVEVEIDSPSLESSAIIENDTAVTSQDVATAPPVATDIPLGTIDQPQTDIQSIVNIVQQLAQKQTDLLLGRPGWVHLQSYWVIVDEFRGSDSLTSPTGQLVMLPNPLIQESWEHIDGTTLIEESLSHMMTEDGTITQQSIYTQNRIVHLTLKEAGYAEADYSSFESSQELILPTLPVAERLAAALTWQKTKVTMEAYAENDQYTVTVRTVFAEPYEDEFFMPGELITGDKMIYIFDLNTGNILFVENYRIIESGAEIYTAHGSYLITEFLSELPSDIAELFDNALNAAAEDLQ